MRPQHRALQASLLLSALIASSAAFAGTVSGTVTDTTGNTVEKVVIKLEPEDPKSMTLTTKTKKKGNFVFGIVREGTYHVHVDVDGYRVSAFRVVGEDKDGKEVIPLTESSIAPGQPMPDLPVGALDKITLDLTLTPSSAGGGAEGTGVAVMATGELAQLIASGKYDKARSEIQRGLDATPDNVSLLYMKGYLELEAKQYDQALEAVDEAIAIDPTLPGIPLLKGVILQSQGNDELALAEFQTELAAGPTEPQVVHDSWMHVAMVARDLEKWDVAKEALDKLIELDPNDVVAYSQLLELAIRQGEGDEAEKILESAPAELRNDPVTYYNLGVQHWNVGDAAGAARSFGKAVELDPSMVDAWRQLGLAEANLGQNDKAVEHLKRYLELAPDAPDAAGLRQYVEKLESAG